MSQFLAVIDPPEVLTCQSLSGNLWRGSPSPSCSRVQASNRTPTVNTVVISCLGDVGVAVDHRYQITGVVEGGAADKSGRLRVGDILLRVNGTCTAALEYERIVSLLRSVDGILELKIMASRGSITDTASDGISEGAAPEAALSSLSSELQPAGTDHSKGLGLVKSKVLAFDLPSPTSGIQSNGACLQTSRSHSHMPRRAQSIAVDGRPSSPLLRRSFVQLRNWQSDKRVTDTLHCRQQSVSSYYAAVYVVVWLFLEFAICIAAVEQVFLVFYLVGFTASVSLILPSWVYSH